MEVEVRINNSLYSNTSYNDSGAYSIHYEEDPEAYFYIWLWMYVTPYVFGLIFICGIIGNSLVVYVIVTKPSMGTVTNLLLLNLAISDIAFLVICVPFTAYKYVAPSWAVGDIICKIVKYFMYVAAYITIYTLVAISLLRYMTVVHGSITTKYRTKRTVSIVIIAIWLITLVVNMPTLFVHKVKEFGENYLYCGIEKYAILPVIMSFFIVGYILPLAAVCVLYIMILQHLNIRRRGSSIEHSHSRARSTHVLKVIILVVVVFCFSWLPLHVQSLVAYFGRIPSGPFYEVCRILWQCMAYGNSCINPIIYNYFSQDFRKCFKELKICCPNREGVHRGMYEGGTLSERTSMIHTNGTSIRKCDKINQTEF